MKKVDSMLCTQQGFSYVEVLVAMFILAIAIVPAMESIQSGIQGAGIHESLTRQHYALIKRMEEVQADSYD
jgi:prepilin-type N-terminal cleavage/methylation domain-containing protein